MTATQRHNRTSDVELNFEVRIKTARLINKHWWGQHYKETQLSFCQFVGGLHRTRGGAHAERRCLCVAWEAPLVTWACVPALGT